MTRIKVSERTESTQIPQAYKHNHVGPLMGIDLESTAIIEVLKKLTIPLMIEARKKEPKRRFPIDLGPLQPADEYAVESFLAAGEVLTICSQLQHSVAYVTQFRSTPKLKESGINRFRHIIYHLENHSIRIRMIFDRILQLINVAFRLGNSSRDCTRRKILQNDYVKNSGVIQPINEIDRILKQNRPTANVVLHQKGLSEPELRFSEMVSLLEEARVEDLPGFAPYAAKREMDKFVVAKETELLRFNQNLLEVVADVLNQLGPECEYRYAELLAHDKG